MDSILFQYMTRFTISGRVVGSVRGESCSVKNGGPSHVQQQQIASRALSISIRECAKMWLKLISIMVWNCVPICKYIDIYIMADADGTFRCIKERKTELQQAIIKMEQGGSSDGILPVRAARVQSDLEQLMRILITYPGCYDS
ncbi:hypothetical protein QN277_021976 [Acacia crassicarpa]|uniref:Uncharacterized protein n=1 Tax=Acacia crassicarpa TaxID=499986 RepID=A0AAE1KFC2_9FABA|nr:hypothetical protein QN277_021976 [Acacia crassicarpa]